jgi:GABA(A) receptor-associated protein
MFDKKIDSLYKNTVGFQERQQESNRIRNKYPDRVACIVEIDSKLTAISDQKKYLVPSDLTSGQFMYVIRKRIKLGPEKAIFLHVGDKNVMPSSSTLVHSIYNEHKDPDGFLYFKVNAENTFGSNGAKRSTK